MQCLKIVREAYMLVDGNGQPNVFASLKFLMYLLCSHDVA